MRKIYTLIMVVMVMVPSLAQVTIDINTLPEAGDALTFRPFTGFEGDTTYRWQGENLEWRFDGISTMGEGEERFIEPDSSLLALYPSANIVLQQNGLVSAGIKTDSSLTLIGVGDTDFFGFSFDARPYTSPYVIMERPIAFGDGFADESSLPFTLAGNEIPGIDSLGLPIIPDSVRVTTFLSRQENATAWGQLDIDDDSYEVLKVEQIDSFRVGIDVLVPFLGWVDFAELLDVLGGGGEGPDLGAFGLTGPMGTTTYRFLAPDLKQPVLEFVENSFTDDSTGVVTTFVNGRISSDVMSSTEPLVESSTLLLYPNPATGLLTLSSGNGDAIGQYEGYRIYDDQGRMVQKATWHRNTASQISVSSLQSGYYSLMLLRADGVVVRPFTVLR